MNWLSNDALGAEMGKGGIMICLKDINLVYLGDLYPVRFTIVTAYPVAPVDGTGVQNL